RRSQRRMMQQNPNYLSGGMFRGSISSNLETSTIRGGREQASSRNLQGKVVHASRKNLPSACFAVSASFFASGFAGLGLNLLCGLCASQRSLRP
ncbi:MAG: hypothetical protein H7842_06495, partial [Gammaproteobacteria bacterium SHHR-1]